MYEVIHRFKDLQDFNHIYKIGDEFPRKGITVSKERLLELSSSQNRQHKPLIKLVEEEPAKSETEQNLEIQDEQYTKTDINRMSKAELVTLAESVGISDAESLSGSKLKESLITHFGL